MVYWRLQMFRDFEFLSASLQRHVEKVRLEMSCHEGKIHLTETRQLADLFIRSSRAPGFYIRDG
jgi:hypothetical protein